MSEEREIKGEIESWSQEPKAFGKNNRGSRGLKVNGDWHNIVDDLGKLKELDTKFPKCSFVKFTEEKNKRGYWDIKGDIVIAPQDANPSTQQPLPKDMPEFPREYKATFIDEERNKNIRLQVAFKGAVEIVKNSIPKDGAPDLDELYNKVRQGTVQLYFEIDEAKRLLKNSEKW